MHGERRACQVKRGGMRDREPYVAGEMDNVHSHVCKLLVLMASVLIFNTLGFYLGNNTFKSGLRFFYNKNYTRTG